LSIDVNSAANKNVPATVKLDASRVSYDTVDTKLTVDYNDTTTIVSSLVQYDFATQKAQEPTSLTIKNTDGVVVSLSRDGNDYKGDLVVGTEKMATIEKSRTYVVRYISGETDTVF
ncbi:hypothetical protein, partial [Vibrio sonorensis]|uniref:hypothetical protein n=1 Tax=Vibrio sonorensis TaxID=1004316 RepID=UPI001586143B